MVRRRVVHVIQKCRRSTFTCRRPNADNLKQISRWWYFLVKALMSLRTVDFLRGHLLFPFLLGLNTMTAMCALADVADIKYISRS